MLVINLNIRRTLPSQIKLKIIFQNSLNYLVFWSDRTYKHLPSIGKASVLTIVTLPTYFYLYVSFRFLTAQPCSKFFHRRNSFCKIIFNKIIFHVLNMKPTCTCSSLKNILWFQYSCSFVWHSSFLPLFTLIRTACLLLKFALIPE